MSCPECGLDYEDMPVADAVAAIRGFGRRYRAPLTRLLAGEDDDVLRRRPAPDVWSALEYAAHVRDVFGFYEVWIRQMLSSDRPELRGPDAEEAARQARYNDQDPGGIAEGVEVRALALAATLERVPEDGWDRVGIREGEERSVLLTARRAVHEGSHHLLDIGRTLRAVRSGATAGPDDSPSAGPDDSPGDPGGTG